MNTDIRKKILITGANGFLGFHVVEKLKKSGYDLYLTSAHGDRNNIFPLNLTHLAQTKEKILEIKPDIIIHLAATVNLTRDYLIGKKCLENNILATMNLLESLRVHKPKLFIFASTEEVYGDTSIPYDENDSVNPPSPYAVSKLACEYLSKIYAWELNFKLAIFRIGTMYGSRQPQERLLSQIINKALRDEKIELNSGVKKRDYIYVDDVAMAICNVLSVKLSNQAEIINLGGGKTYSLLELVSKIVKMTNSKSKIITGVFSDRIGEADEWLLSISKAKRILNWQPNTPLEKGLSKTLRFYDKSGR